MNGSSQYSTTTEKKCKKDKGRFKKLRKRLDNVSTQQHVSGFCSMDDLNEWEEVASNSINAPKAIPQFFWRNGCTPDRRVEGSHHRDILFSLLSTPTTVDNQEIVDGNGSNGSAADSHDMNIGQEIVPGKKRRWHESNSLALSREAMLKYYQSLPHWLCLHNPVSIRHVGVVEVHLSARHQMTLLHSQIEEHLRNSDRSHIVTPTRWFTGGSQVKCISDSLLFASTPKPSDTNRPTAKSIKDLTDLIGELGNLALTREDLVKSNYPVSSLMISSSVPHGDSGDRQQTPPNRPFDGHSWFSSPKSCSESKQREAAGCGRKLWALDCEMVETTHGRALARFTLIEATRYDPHNKHLSTRVALDTLVQPENRVVNYLTQYSGVTSELLQQGPTLSLPQLHEFLLSHVEDGDILVGHSLENDLLVSRWIHPCCVDTALLFSRRSGTSFKYSLRHLTRTLLKREIQQADKPHCSEEDAKAALDLAVGRVIHGPEFGPSQSLNQWAAMTKNQKNMGNSAVALGPSPWLQKYITHPPNTSHALSCESSNDSNSKALVSFLGAPVATKKRAGLVYANFRIGASSSNREQEEMEACGSLIRKLVDSVSPSDTVLLIALQCQYHEAVENSQRRTTLRNPKSTLTWTDRDQEALHQNLEESRMGLAIWVGGVAAK